LNYTLIIIYLCAALGSTPTAELSVLHHVMAKVRSLMMWELSVSINIRASVL